MTYRVDDNGWTWMPVVDILQQTYDSVDYSYDDRGFSWELMLREKCADTGFMHLIYSIMEYGWKSAVGWDNGYITEGHHRLAAAILLCEEEIPVTPDSTEWNEDSTDQWSNQVISAHENYDDPQPFYWREYD